MIVGRLLGLFEFKFEFEFEFEFEFGFCLGFSLSLGFRDVRVGLEVLVELLGLDEWID